MPSEIDFSKTPIIPSDILKQPDLFERINKEFDKKITGEQKSRKAIFLSLCSIWVDGIDVPLNTFVSSQSSTGKSFVSKKVVKIFPENKLIWRSKITAEAFTYWKTNDPSWNWDGIILYLEDISQNVLDSPTFRVMCSEGSTATVVRNQRAVDLEVFGKPIILVTTATTNPSTEILNRFNIIQLDETERQTFNITKSQAQQKISQDYDKNLIASLGLLQRKKVYVPFAMNIHSYLAEHYTFEDIRLRRDFDKLLSLIKCSTALYQMQRELDKNKRLISTKQDYEIARDVINYISGTTLKGLTHKLKRAYSLCVEEGEFTAKQIRSKHPFVSEKMWYIYLDQLCERDLLTTELGNIEGVKQSVTIYKVPKQVSFNLPSYEELMNVTIVSEVSEVTKATKVTKVRENEGTIETIETIVLEIPLKISEERVKTEET